MPRPDRRYRADRPIVPELAAGAVVVHRGTGDVFLLHYRDEDRWGLPKGHVDPGESLEVAALREVREETGLREVELGPEIAEVSYRFYDADRGVNVHKATVYFLAATDQTDAEPEHLFDTVGWVSLPDAMKKVAYETEREVLAGAQARLAVGPAKD